MSIKILGHGRTPGGDMVRPRVKDIVGPEKQNVFIEDMVRHAHCTQGE